MLKHDLRGAGLGLRRELIPDLRSGVPDAIDFLELAPENWLEQTYALLGAPPTLFSMGHGLLEKMRLADIILGTLSRR